MIPGTEVQQPAVDGGTLQLTINRDLQWYLQQLIAEQVQDMGAKRGTITVVEVATGKIRAAAEYPSVDPNDVSASEVKNQYSHIFTDPFEPGSTFKALTGSIVLDAGGQDSLSTVVASDWENFANGARVTDAFNHPAYTYTLAGVLIDSSNAGISKFSERVSAQTRFDYLQKFGIGTGSAVDFEGESNGCSIRSSSGTTSSSTTRRSDRGDHHGARTRGRLRRDRERGPADAALAGRVVHQGRRHGRRPRAAGADAGDHAETTADDAQILENVRCRRATRADRDPGLSPRDQDRHRREGRRQRPLQGRRLLHDDDRLRAGRHPQYLVAVTLDEPTKVKSSAANAPAFQKAMTQVLKTYRVMPATTAPTVLPKFGGGRRIRPENR